MRGSRFILYLLAVIFAVAAAAVFAAGCGDGDDTGAAYEQYFLLLEAELHAFERQIDAVTQAGRNLAGEDLGANLGAYAAELEARAIALDDIAAPGVAAEPHRRFIVAFRNLADAKQLQSDRALGLDSGLSEVELEQRSEARSSEWFDLCHVLQDIALVREIDVDLKCVTALRRR
jgi:hypothetical protein